MTAVIMVKLIESRQLVAVKVIRAGMNFRQVQARSKTERQALALMDHPTIAMVFHAGAAGRGVGRGVCHNPGRTVGSKDR
jgi:eukaryotic-like serine/threonine-protein kinase